jgi:hypothetical protein
MDREEAKILARLSEGSLGKALRMAEGDLLADRAGWVHMLDRAINGAPDVLLDTAQKFSDLGKKAGPSKELKDDGMALMLGIWKSWFRDMVLIKLGGAIDLMVNTDLAVIARAEHDLMDNKNSLILIERALFGLKGAAHL